MTKTKTLGLASLLAVSAFVLLTGFHGGCGKDTPEARARWVERMASAKVDDFMDDLDANDQQTAKVHTIKDRLLKQALPLFEDHQKAKAELKHEWESNETKVYRRSGVIHGDFTVVSEDGTDGGETPPKPRRLPERKIIDVD